MAYTSKDYDQLRKLLNQMQSGDFILMANSTAINLAVRLGSNSPYGHAAIYVGKQIAFELPVKTATVHKLMVDYGSTSVAFVHCRQLNRKQREQIVTAARTYKRLKSNSFFRGYDIIGTVTQGVGSLLRSTNELYVDGLWGGKTKVPYALDKEAKELSRDIAAIEAIAVNELASLVIQHPNLSCSGLISWCHAAGSNTIVGGRKGKSNTVSPKDLWAAVKANPAKYRTYMATF